MPPARSFQLHRRVSVSFDVASACDHALSRPGRGDPGDRPVRVPRRELGTSPSCGAQSMRRLKARFAVPPVACPSSPVDEALRPPLSRESRFSDSAPSPFAGGAALRFGPEKRSSLTSASAVENHAPCGTAMTASSARNPGLRIDLRGCGREVDTADVLDENRLAESVRFIGVTVVVALALVPDLS
jgi:hypothetical protein